VANVRLMMAFGQSANDALAATKMLGDVAGSDQERLNRLALAYAQVMAAGKMQGQDLLQFVNAGFNPLQELSQKTGKSVGTLRKEMEKGLISAQMVKEAFASATGPGGRFFGNMEKQSKTLTGLWSTLRDNFHMMMAELGGQLVPFIKDVVTALIGMTDSIAGAYRQLGDFFSLMFSDGPTAQEIAAGIAAAFGTIADAIMAIGASFQFVMWAIDVFQTGVAQIFGGIIDFALYIPKALVSAARGVVQILQILNEAMPDYKNKETHRKNLAKVSEQMLGGMEWLGGGDSSMMAWSKRATENGMNAISGSWSKFRELGSMIGGSANAPTGSKTAPTDAMLKALQGKVVNNNITTNVTVHAEGSMKDILTEQANSIFGNVIGVQLRAASV